MSRYGSEKAPPAPGTTPKDLPTLKTPKKVGR
jgi:hypothetical protein